MVVARAFPILSCCTTYSSSKTLFSCLSWAIGLFMNCVSAKSATMYRRSFTNGWKSVILSAALCGSETEERHAGPFLSWIGVVGARQLDARPRLCSACRSAVSDSTVLIHISPFDVRHAAPCPLSKTRP